MNKIMTEEIPEYTSKNTIFPGKDFIERFAEIVQEDKELRNAVIRMINAHAEAQEIKNFDKRQKQMEKELYARTQSKNI